MNAAAAKVYVLHENPEWYAPLAAGLQFSPQREEMARFGRDVIARW